MDPLPDEGVVMDPGVSPQDFSGHPSQHDFRSNNGAISKHKKGKTLGSHIHCVTLGRNQ